MQLLSIGHRVELDRVGNSRCYCCHRSAAVVVVH